MIGPGDVLVQVQACGVNHSDLDSRAGTSRWPFELPMVLGAEFTGTVVGVGDQAGPIHTGDLVTALQQYSCGRCAPCARWRPDLCAAFEIFGTTRWGGYGELVCVPAEVVVPLDAGDDPLAVAAGQCAVSTAWHMVNRLALVRPGDLVLVPSASGGVAGALVQCAKLAGATVIATVGAAAKAQRVSLLGADMVIVRGDGDIATELMAPPVAAASTRSSTPWAATSSGPICPYYARKARSSPAVRTPARWFRSTCFPVQERLADRRLPAGAARRAGDVAGAHPARVGQGAHRRHLPHQRRRRGASIPGTAPARRESAPGCRVSMTGAYSRRAAPVPAWPAPQVVFPA